MTSDNSTVVGHNRHDDPDIDIGRGPNLEAITNTEIGDPGWLGNPFVLESTARQEHYDADHLTVVGSREESVRRFRDLLDEQVRQDKGLRNALRDLHGKTLGCWCQRADEENGDLCHGQAVAAYADYFGEIDPEPE